MIRILLAASAVLAWMTLGAWGGIWLCPQMIMSGAPNLILLAYLLPACWLIASVLAYIGWAECAWRPDPLLVEQHVIHTIPRHAQA